MTLIVKDMERVILASTIKRPEFLQNLMRKKNLILIKREEVLSL
jgi:hypothetical protein